MKKQTVLVTGATGFVGSHLVRRLVNEKCNVHCILRPRSSLHRIKDQLTHITIHHGDLLDEKSLKKIVEQIQPTFIFHLATVGIYGGVESDPQVVFDTNTKGTINLVNACTDIPYACFVNTGSSSEYGKKTKPMSEDDVCFPESVYAISKLAATLYCKSYAQLHKKRLVTLRLFSPYGKDDSPRRLIPYVLTHSLVQLGNKHAVRDYIYIEDVVDAYIACMRRYQFLSSEIINIGSGKERSVEEVVSTILSLVQNKKVMWEKNIVQYESPMWQADIRKAWRLLKWKPKYQFKEGIQVIARSIPYE